METERQRLIVLHGLAMQTERELFHVSNNTVLVLLKMYRLWNDYSAIYAEDCGYLFRCCRGEAELGKELFPGN